MFGIHQRHFVTVIWKMGSIRGEEKGMSTARRRLVLERSLEVKASHTVEWLICRKGREVHAMCMLYRTQDTEGANNFLFHVMRTANPLSHVRSSEFNVLQFIPSGMRVSRTGKRVMSVSISLSFWYPSYQFRLSGRFTHRFPFCLVERERREAVDHIGRQIHIHTHTSKHAVRQKY